MTRNRATALTRWHHHNEFQPNLFIVQTVTKSIVYSSDFTIQSKYCFWLLTCHRHFNAPKILACLFNVKQCNFEVGRQPTEHQVASAATDLGSWLDSLLLEDSPSSCKVVSLDPQTHAEICTRLPVGMAVNRDGKFWYIMYSYRMCTTEILMMNSCCHDVGFKLVFIQTSLSFQHY